MAKAFDKPTFEAVYFDKGVLTTSGCGCYDAMFCPTNYKNCTGDGSECECQTNYNPAIANCICTNVQQ